MRFHKVSRNRQTESAALNFCSGNTEVTVENTLVVTGIDAFTEILNVQVDHISFLPGANHDTPVFFRITDRIAEQISQYPSYLFTIDKELADFLFRVLYFYLDIELIR